MQVKTKSLIVGGLAVLMVGLLWYRVVYSPIKSKTSKANATAHTAQTEADNLQKAIDDLQSANKKDAAKEVDSAKLLQAVPADAAEASFLRSLDLLRASTGADWQSVTPGTPTSAGSVTSINVAITVQGNEEQLARYLSGLYAMKRIFIPDNVTLAQGGSTAPAGGVTAPAGALFVGGPMQLQVSGRIFAGAAATASPSTSGTTSTGSSASTGTSTTGGATAPPGVQSN